MLKKLSQIGFATWTGFLSILILCAFFLPNTGRGILPYRFHYVLTNSMEPTIETHSLVLVKTCDDPMRIQKGDIIAFLADRFGERIVIMHRFSHMERNEEGEIVYKTHPEGTDTLDVYETTREDILGVYLWHIPNAGKFLLFLRSEFGLLWICQMLTILLVKGFVEARWKEKEAADA